MGTPLPLPKKGAEPPNFRPVIIVAKRLWMHEDVTWYGGKLQPRRLCVRWEPSHPPKKGRSPQFWAHIYCDQTGAWIKMPLGMEVGLGPCRRLYVRWGPSYRQKKGTPTPTQFLAHVYCGQTAGWLKTPFGTEVDIGPGHIVLDGVPALRERGTATTPPLFSAHCLLWPRSPIPATAELLSIIFTADWH